MKNTIAIIAFLASIYSLNAQRIVEKQIQVNSSTSINLNLEFADSILIKQSKDNTLRIKAIVSVNDNQNNDKYELITTENTDLVKVKAKINDMESIRIPCKSNYRGSSYHSYHGKCLTMEIFYEIEVPNIAKLNIETINGDITINNTKSPMFAKSISGFIDLKIPTKSDINIHIETVTGGVYTNHEFNKDSDRCDTNPGSTDASFKLGNGGSKIKLVTVSGDIFVRKM